MPLALENGGKLIATLMRAYHSGVRRCRGNASESTRGSPRRAMQPLSYASTVALPGRMRPDLTRFAPDVKPKQRQRGTSTGTGAGIHVRCVAFGCVDHHRGASNVRISGRRLGRDQGVGSPPARDDVSGRPADRLQASTIVTALGPAKTRFSRIGSKWRILAFLTGDGVSARLAEAAVASLDRPVWAVGPGTPPNDDSCARSAGLRYGSCRVTRFRYVRSKSRKWMNYPVQGSSRSAVSGDRGFRQRFTRPRTRNVPGRIGALAASSVQANALVYHHRRPLLRGHSVDCPLIRHRAICAVFRRIRVGSVLLPRSLATWLNVAAR